MTMYLNLIVLCCFEHEKIVLASSLAPFELDLLNGLSFYCNFLINVLIAFILFGLSKVVVCLLSSLSSNIAFQISINFPQKVSVPCGKDLPPRKLICLFIGVNFILPGTQRSMTLFSVHGR